MNKYKLLLLLILPLFLNAQVRDRKLFNEGWKFQLGDHTGANNPAFNDASWRTLNLPHDWSIEGKFDKANPAKPEGGALPTGIAWYRKSFSVPASFTGKNVSITFDGVYQHSEVWVNGKYLGKRPNGYITFSYDLTPYLLKNKTNVIAVKVDNSDQPNSRWYSGSGIYRNVWLTAVNNIHIAQWGTFVTTPEVSKASARVAVKTQISSKVRSSAKIQVRQSVIDAAGKLVSRVQSVVDANSDNLTLDQDIKLSNPHLWSVESPYMYSLKTELLQGTKLIDVYNTPFGVRYFNFDAEKGFSLNGEHMIIKGVCMHHDLGALGAAINTRAIERQLQLLKGMGCNGIRTSHNPPAPELLDLCDKMGFIVMDETFDMWAIKKNKRDYHLDFPEWHKRDLEDHVMRDRNHPSIFMWSIGNEIREQFDTTGVRVTRELTGIVRNLDNTRAVVSALTEMNPAKNNIAKAGVLDILGFNYNDSKYDSLPIKFKGAKFLGSETTSAIATRGYYDTPTDTIRLWPFSSKIKFTPENANSMAPAHDNVAAYWGTTHEHNWKSIKDRPFMTGMYVWTGFDYLGEPAPFPWPARSSYFGIFDLAGFPKDSYYMYKSEWTKEDVLHILPHWNWKAGQSIDVWGYYNNADEVELYVNGKSAGIRKKGNDDLHVSWKVSFEPGELKAVSRRNGKTVKTEIVKTAGVPAKISLKVDRNKIRANGTDLSFVTVEIQDKDGNMIPDADNLVNFKLSGPASIAGVDNGYQASMEPFKANYRKAFNGKCLAIIQSAKTAGSITLTASSAGLSSASVTISAAK